MRVSVRLRLGLCVTAGAGHGGDQPMVGSQEWGLYHILRVRIRRSTFHVLRMRSAVVLPGNGDGSVSNDNQLVREVVLVRGARNGGLHGVF